MKRASFLPWLVAGWFLLVFGSSALGQSTGDETQSPALPAVSQREPRTRLPVLGGADEFALAVDLQYYAPAPGFNSHYRDINLLVAQAALAAHFRHGWEFQFDALALRASGTAILSSSPPIPPPVPSNALALGFGPLARWNFLQFSRFRLFIDGEGDFILADRPFPPHGTIYDFFLRAGGGVSVQVSDSYWVETAFRVAHVSNAQGFVSDNPTWDGVGLSIGVRRTFRPYDQGAGKPDSVLSQPGTEQAWITSIEDYWAAPGSNLQNPKVRPEIGVIRISRAWSLQKGFEFQLGGMVANPKQFANPNEIAGFGPLLRWNFVEVGRLRLFADAGADFIQTGSPAYVIPLAGVGYNFFLRAGSGASLRLHSAYWLDASFRWGYITSGFGPGGNNYTPWNGLGAALALRHTFPR
jgi:hypothetical protein